MLLPPNRLGFGGQSIHPTAPRAGQPNKSNARLKHSRWHTQTKMIKEDHYLACTTRMFEILLDPAEAGPSRIAKSLCTPELFGSHPRGYPIHSLVKEQTNKLVFPEVSLRGGGIISTVPPLSTGCRKKIFTTSTSTANTRNCRSEWSCEHRPPGHFNVRDFQKSIAYATGSTNIIRRSSYTAANPCQGMRTKTTAGKYANR